MLIACVADIHTHLIPIPDCDILIIAGDLSFSHKGDVFDETRFLYGEFMPWCREIAARGIKIIAIAGNHDFLFQKAPDLVPERPDIWTYLQDDFIVYKDLKIYGSPWQPVYYDWAFNLPEEELWHKWQHIPSDTDILVTHGPPYGFGDTSGGSKVGSHTLAERIRVIKPKLHVCGHIHNGYGVYDLDGTTVVNAAIVDMRYQPVKEPIIIDTDNWRPYGEERHQTGNSDPQGFKDAPGQGDSSGVTRVDGLPETSGDTV